MAQLQTLETLLTTIELPIKLVCEMADLFPEMGRPVGDSTIDYFLKKVARRMEEDREIPAYAIIRLIQHFPEQSERLSATLIAGAIADDRLADLEKIKEAGLLGSVSDSPNSDSSRKRLFHYLGTAADNIALNSWKWLVDNFVTADYVKWALYKYNNIVKGGGGIDPELALHLLRKIPMGKDERLTIIEKASTQLDFLLGDLDAWASNPKLRKSFDDKKYPLTAVYLRAYSHTPDRSARPSQVNLGAVESEISSFLPLLRAAIKSYGISVLDDLYDESGLYRDWLDAERSK